MNDRNHAPTIFLALALLAAPGASAGSDAVPAPTDVAAEVMEDGTVLLTWVAPDGLAFNVYRNGDLVGTTEEPSYSDGQPEPVGEYVVTTISSGTESDASDSVTVVTVGASHNSGGSPLLDSPATAEFYGGISTSCLPAHVTLALNTPPFVFATINDRCIPGLPWKP